MRLGATYNLFEGGELLRGSIEAIRSKVDYINVIYQKISNTGEEPYAEDLSPLLGELQRLNLIDTWNEYIPKEFPENERRKLVSKRSNIKNLNAIENRFFNELQKREMGRKCCVAAKCDYFMALDVDEYYKASELQYCKDFLSKNTQYEGLVCQMRTFFKAPIYELMPKDDLNFVNVIYKSCFPFQLDCQYPVLLDPTRKVEGLTRLHIMERSEIEMYHYSYIRNDIRVKTHIPLGIDQFNCWKHNDPLMYPINTLFQTTRIVANYFGISFTK